MRSIKARFNEQERKTPTAGAYINLQRAVRGQRFLRKALVSSFNELIPKDDYLSSEKTGLINWLEIRTSKPKT